jgi:hypothetical protein
MALGGRAVCFVPGLGPDPRHSIQTPVSHNGNHAITDQRSRSAMSDRIFWQVP